MIDFFKRIFNKEVEYEYGLHPTLITCNEEGGIDPMITRRSKDGLEVYVKELLFRGKRITGWIKTNTQ